jgi:BirA family transcriptional regulator, biotin operon repressor / biotin---[acetyl-CoA-carboxylase] ligase
MRNYTIIKVGEVDSTNNYARGLVVSKGAEECTVVLAEYQSRGRGVGINSWESEKGKNLTFSLILKPAFLEPGKQFYLSMAVSLGICDFISDEVGSCKIKWPNDIYVSIEKVGGILIENIIQGNTISDSIIGVGLNINQEKFVSDAPNPVSLKQITGKEYNLDQCFEEIYSSILSWYETLKAGAFETVGKAYTSVLFGMGTWATYKTGDLIFNGRILGIDEFGQLKIEDSDNQIRLFKFKEVEYLFTGKEVL